jgi:cytochrome P450
VAAVDEIDLSGQAFWRKPAPEREAAFAVLRRQAPISWQRGPDSVLLPDQETTGYWAVVRYDDVRKVSRDPATFCSGEGVMFEDADPTLLEASMSFLATDAPRHTKLRGLVNAAFTPRQVRRIDERIRERAREIVDELAPLGECDFVEQVARRLPMITIAEYKAANRDEDAFDHPERFDVLRSPNHHVGFGGGGPHYCLGASLARTQLRSIFSGLLTRVPDIEAGEPEPLVGNFIDGIKRMPCRFTPR